MTNKQHIKIKIPSSPSNPAAMLAGIPLGLAVLKPLAMASITNLPDIGRVVYSHIKLRRDSKNFP